MRLRASRAVILAVLVLAVAGGYLAILPPGPYPLSVPPDLPESSSLVRGAFHVHTNRSDGGGAVESIAAAARAAGLQFVIFSDHGDGTRVPDEPSYRSGVLCIDGVEISARGGHYIAVGLRSPTPYPLGGDVAGVVEDVRRLGGFGVAAHPTSSKPALAWTEPDLVGVGGFEWLNGDSQWRDDSWLALSRAAVSYVARPAAALASLLDRPDDALAWWDTRPGRRLVGLAGADAHARLALGRGGEGEGYDEALEIAFPGYEQVFRTFSVRVELDAPWTGQALVDAASLIRAIRAGRTFTVIDALAAPGVFRFTGMVDGREVPMGGRVQDSAAPIEFRAATSEGLPRGAVLVLLHDGQVVARSEDSRLRHVASEPGTYRVEARLPFGLAGRGVFPWIVSNPIYVGDEPAASPGALAAAARLLPLAATRQGEPAWVTESDLSSSARVDVTGDSVIFRYELGERSATGVYAAAVYHVRPGELASFDRLTLEAGADRPHRVSVQLRAGRLNGQGRWLRSRYIGPTVATVTVPFADLVGVDSVSGMDRVPLGDIDAILVVVDLTNSPPAAVGTLTLRDVRLEAGSR